MDHYQQSGAEIPACSFAPDASFPAIFAEKGCVYFDLSTDAAASGILSISGGTASNAVPESCRAQVKAKDGRIITLEASGVAAHASLPEQGENAISKLMEQLYALHMAGELDCPAAVFYHEKIGLDFTGAGFGISGSDESGALTFNVGTARLEEGKLIFSVDIRYPVTWSGDTLLTRITEQAGAYGVTLQNAGASGALYMPKDHTICLNQLVSPLHSI